jgi:hypothetical protein
MKQHVLGLLLGIVGMYLVSCGLQSSDSDAETPIQPGDTMGGFRFSIGDPDEIVDLLFLTSFDEVCHREGSEITCTQAPGEMFNPTYSFYGNSQQDLDDVWSEKRYEVFIKNRPVDLEAFGSVDFEHPDTGWPMRAWNVAVQASEPVVLVARHVGEVEDETFDDTMTITVE